MGFSQNNKGENLWRGPTIFRILNRDVVISKRLSTSKPQAYENNYEIAMGLYLHKNIPFL